MLTAIHCLLYDKLIWFDMENLRHKVKWLLLVQYLMRFVF